MTLEINGEKVQAESGRSLSEVLSALSLYAGNGVAVAVNDRVLPRASWPEFKPQDGDQITLLRAAQGG